MTTVKIQEVDVEYIKRGKKGWYQATVNYTDEAAEKNFSKKFMSFKNPDVFKVLQEAAPGQRYEVDVKKEGDFWEWVSIEPAGEAKVAVTTPKGRAAGTATSTGRDWETAEERALKQVYIVKQSSIASAIQLATLSPEPYDVNKILEVAQKFVDYVFATDDASSLDGEVAE